MSRVYEPFGMEQTGRAHPPVFAFRKGAGAKSSSGDIPLKPLASSRKQSKGPSDQQVSLDRMSLVSMRKTRGGREWCAFRCPVHLFWPHLCSLPPEILLCIFTYLDAASLLSAGCVNRLFYQLARDNFIWGKIYAAAFPPKTSSWRASSMAKMEASVGSLNVQDLAPGHWKEEFIQKQIGLMRAVLVQELKPVKNLIGLSTKTLEVFRTFGLGWTIVLKQEHGKKHILCHSHLANNESSVTVTWYSQSWPPRATLATLDLYGVIPLFRDHSYPPSKPGPRWYSLITTYNLHHLSEAMVIGSDSLVRIFRLDPGLLVGLWQRNDELAFIMAHLHSYRLLERSTLGSATSSHELSLPVPLEDHSPECALQDYQLHMDMHSGGVFHLCGTFSLFARKGHIENGFVKLVFVSAQNERDHLPLIGKLGLFWKTQMLKGHIQNCSILDATLLDECRRPFWCLSIPVCLVQADSKIPQLRGPTYSVDYADAEGRVHLELLWLKETGEFIIISLVLFLSIDKVNRWFGTCY
ncbi:F-box only protein 15 [Suncus etruscus]|uniref:F-box only protein 15 n=1 Tax=Suncus etruscus TaxID=109475 RepID=UPI0021109910|nr:F-box only protein 15 [Suncus etruscus]